jgi:hypothetical protein
VTRLKSEPVLASVLGSLSEAVFEYLSLAASYETKEAGEANEKMVSLALKDKNILYTDYSALGYVYLPPDVEVRNPETNTEGDDVIVRLIRGDPSKDWVSPPTYQFPYHDTCKQEGEQCLTKRKPKSVCDKVVSDCEKPAPTYRYEDFDLSPIVCKCKMKLSACSMPKAADPLQLHCEAAGDNPLNDDSCNTIDKNTFIDIPSTPSGYMLLKWKLPKRR